MIKKIFSVIALLLLFGCNYSYAQTDWNRPSNSSTKTNFPIEIRQLAYQCIRQDATQYDTATNLPNHAMQYNRATDQLEEYDGVSTWTTAPVGIPVGTVIQQFATTAPTGFLLLAGGTIGSASSGATLRANADTALLFSHLWTNLANAEAAVSGGRGASAAADFAAHKTLTIPDMRQKFPLAKAASGTGSTLGGTGGSIDLSHTHAMPHTHNMGNHTHTITHTHNMGNHTHSTPAHSHASGTLRAAIGSNPGSGENVYMALDGTNTFTASYRYLVPTSTFTGDGSTVASTVVNGSTASDGSGTSGGPSTNTTDGSNTASSGAPSSNVSDGTNTANTSANSALNPPFLAFNFFIKY